MMKKSVEIYHRGMIFSVEYATELLGVISILCENQDAICDAGAEWGNSEYRNEVLAHFDAWKGCEVTKILETLSDDYNFNFDAPVDLFLQRKHGFEPNLEVLCRHRKSIPPELFSHFLDLVDRSEIQSGFSEFYEAHRTYYEVTLRRFIEDYDAFQPLDFFDGVSGHCH